VGHNFYADRSRRWGAPCVAGLVGRAFQLCGRRRLFKVNPAWRWAKFPLGGGETLGGAAITFEDGGGIF